MKLRKIMALATAAALAGTMAVSASATLVKYETEDPTLCSSGDGAWLVQVFNVGSPAENKSPADYGIDLSKIAAVTFTIKSTDVDFFEGAFGGSVVFSVNGGDIGDATSDLHSKYNWPGCEFWGCVDEDLGIETYDADKPGKVTKVGDMTYEVTNDTLVNPFVEEGDTVKEVGCVQVGLQEWGSELEPLEVLSCEVKDADGNVLIAFDSVGTPTDADGNALVNKALSGEEPEDTDAPDTDAPETDAPETDAPTTGDTSKPSTDTGVEGIAVAAGVAVIATGAAIVAKKRK